MILIVIIIVSPFECPDQVIIVLVVSFRLFAALYGIFTTPSSMIIIIFSVLGLLIIGKLMLIAFPGMIVAIIVVIPTKLIETKLIELVPIWVIEPLVVRQYIEPKLIIFATFDLRYLVCNLRRPPGFRPFLLLVLLLAPFVVLVGLIFFVSSCSCWC